MIDQKSGRKTSSIPVGDIALVLTNYESDRIYVASAQGLVQCVRDVSSPRPIFHSSEFDTSIMEDGKKKPKKKSTDDEDPFGEDPFDDGGDPFGDDGSATKNDPATDDENPFGSSDEDDDDGNPFN